MSDEAPLGGQKMTTAVVAMIMKEVPAFTQMEVDPGVTMKIRGVTMEMALISLLNAEPFHLQGGRTILTEYPGMTPTQRGLWSLVPVHHLLIALEAKASTQHPERSQRVEKTH